MEKPQLYFPRDIEWREWLHNHHPIYPQGVHLIFYKLEMNQPTMRWEEAVKVAICYGWIDSTVRSLGNGKRQQYFCPRNPKSSWSALNKKYVRELEADGLIHESGWQVIEKAKELGSWSAMDEVENGIIPEDLFAAFQLHPLAHENYLSFSVSYRKSYLSWLSQAKRKQTREQRIKKIIEYCKAGLKSRT